jgi:hypothetical protein
MGGATVELNADEPLSRDLTGTGSLTKTGTGTLTLTGANTSGATRSTYILTGANIGKTITVKVRRRTAPESLLRQPQRR